MLSCEFGSTVVVWLMVLDSCTMGSRVWVTGPICEMLALVDWVRPEVNPGILTPAACWLPATPWPDATVPACEALLGTPGNVPPASERVTFQPRMTGL